MRYSSNNFITAFLSVFIALMAMIPVTGYAFFSEESPVKGSAFDVATLDTAIDQPSFNSLISSNELAEIEFEVITSDPINAQYEVVAIKAASCMPAFFNGIDVIATHNTDVHEGAMAGFVATTTHEGVWNFTFSASSSLSALENEECEFALHIRSWQDGFRNYGEGGFFQEDTVTVTLVAEEEMGNVQAQNIVINEFLPHPDGEMYGFDFGDDSSDKPQGEWVELYNAGDEPVDLTGWYVHDASVGNGNTVVISPENISAHLSPETTVIPSGGFLILYFNKPTLNNTGDVVKLYNPANILIDSIEYGDTSTACMNEPTAGEGNIDTTTGSCNASNVPANKSFARIPDGGEWVDPIPTPGLPNVATEEDLAQEGWSESEIDAVLPPKEEVIEVVEDKKTVPSENIVDLEESEEIAEEAVIEVEDVDNKTDPKDESETSEDLEESSKDDEEHSIEDESDEDAAPEENKEAPKGEPKEQQETTPSEQSGDTTESASTV